MANNIVNNPAIIPQTRLPDQNREQTRNDPSKPGEPGLSANATGFFRLPDGAEQHGSNTGDNQDGGGNGSGNTMLAKAISGLSDSGIHKVSKKVVDNLTGRTVAQTPEVGAVQDNFAGVSTYGDGTFRNAQWDAAYASTQGRTIPVTRAVSDDEALQIRSARSIAQINERGVNPIVISRDRALGNG